MQYQEYPERPYAAQDPYQYRDPATKYGGQHELEPSAPYHTNYAAHGKESHFTFDNYDAGYDPRYGAGDLAHYQQYSAPTSPRSPTRPEAQPAQGYSSHVQYPSSFQYGAEPEPRGYGQVPPAGRYDLDRYASPSRDVVDYRQSDYIPERKSHKADRYSGHHEQNRYPGYAEQNKHYDDYDRGYSSADEHMYRHQGRYEPSKRQHKPRKHLNDPAKYEIPPPDYTVNRYDDRYYMGDLARALPPAHKSGRAAQRHETNNYGRSADDRGIKYHKSGAGYPKYGSPDFDYKGFQKRTSQIKQMNQRAVEQARPPPQQARYDWSRPAYNDGRYRAQYPRY